MKKSSPLAVFLLALLAVAGAGCGRSKEQPSASPEPSAKATTENPVPPKVETVAPKTAEPSAAPTAEAPATASAQPRNKAAPVGARAERTISSSATPAPPAASAAPVVTGAPVGAEAFSVYLQARGSYRRDQPSSVEAVLLAKDPFHCNDKYPYKFTLDPPAANVKYDAQVVRGMSIAAKRSVMTIPFVGTAAGPAQISGELAFSVCTESKCLMEKRRLSVRVNVE